MRGYISANQLRADAAEWMVLSDRAKSAGFTEHARSLEQMAQICEDNANRVQKSREKSDALHCKCKANGGSI
jgi:hypothetical protein